MHNYTFKKNNSLWFSFMYAIGYTVIRCIINVVVADSYTAGEVEKINIDEIINIDIGCLSVKVLRKAIPKLRIICYEGSDANSGKKKCRI